MDAVLALLGVGVADVRARLTDGRGDEVPGRVLDLHHVWDFYRTRFLLRRVRAYRRFLDVADELAWECYGPVLGLAGARPKEPPLVGFSRAASPRAHRRGSAYHDLLPRGGVHTREGREAAARLPFPVIDVPWSFGSHLPALLTVAHEAAHHIDDDCGLGDEIRRRVATAALPPDRTVHWERWAGEAFADVCAAVLCGPAYAAVLAELLDTEADVDEVDFDGAHPPPGARLRLAGAAARLAGHAGTADDRDHEARAVAGAMVAGGWSGLDGLSLPELFATGRPAGPAEVSEGARRLLAGGPSRCPSATGVLAAAALAFQYDPAGYDGRAVGERAVSEVLRLRSAGTRAAPSADPPGAERGRAHEKAGRAVLAALDAAPDPGPGAVG
ncbi:hypothetical protein AQI95_25355 [Streptomyces yokosukanensis]|uniref:Uncharacterized protein n=1 Tax=Streptomyces yokosukanensis TaxID=67386 RepID=A0A117Q1D0_9ACTN|nr:hypothetical protein [Streptomyces yokosukanensis]KUN02861.1 hypothetical protein AQI95_25355 [Streptomyces yokosukanensis]